MILELDTKNIKGINNDILQPDVAPAKPVTPATPAVDPSKPVTPAKPAVDPNAPVVNPSGPVDPSKNNG